VTNADDSAKVAKEFRAEASPQRLERGRYLVEGPAHGFMCHGEQDYAHGSSLPLPGRNGVGKILKGELYDGMFSPDGLVCPNITPDKTTHNSNGRFATASAMTEGNYPITCLTLSSGA